MRPPARASIFRHAPVADEELTPELRFRSELIKERLK
jgi:hypothetical protein